jgi:hypothetical protein
VNGSPKSKGHNMAGNKFSKGSPIARSDFLIALRQQFFNATDRATWPTSRNAKQRKSQAAEQAAVALKAMIRAAALGKPLPTAAATSALGRVRTAAAATGWPKAASKAPTAWTGSEAKYRLFEVAAAVDIMMHALANKGGGGGPKDWPNGGTGRN